MKLKVHKRNRKYDDSWQHCCRYCHHYSNGVCMNLDAGGYIKENASYGEWLNYAGEEGKIQEVLEEKLQEYKIYSAFLDDISRVAIKCGLPSSGKRFAEFKNGLKDCYDIFVGDCSPHLDEGLCSALKDYEQDWCKSDKVEIINPDTFVCNFWE